MRGEKEERGGEGGEREGRERERETERENILLDDRDCI